jgi:hypothetical protein
LVFNVAIAGVADCFDTHYLIGWPWRGLGGQMYLMNLHLRSDIPFSWPLLLNDDRTKQVDISCTAKGRYIMAF